MPRRVTVRSVVAIVLGLLAQTAMPPLALAQRAAPGQAPQPLAPPQQRGPLPPQVAPPSAPVLKAEQLTREQFDRLPDTAVIEMKGTRITAGEFRAQIARQRAEGQTKVRAAASQAKTAFEAYRAKFLQEQKSKLQAVNAKVQAQFAAYRSQGAGPARSAAHETIQKEALDLQRRARTASPAEQAQIEQRARELLQQLQQVPR